ncbi:MAG: hypothetical protein JWN84_2832 [Nocardioides sp.]|nr:hypothetical protein [Nocardioides sp.]
MDAQPRAVETFAAGRWPVVVRTLVLLGAPPVHAEALAVEALGRFFARCAEDQWLDLDVTLAAEVVEAWDTDRTPWWQRPGLAADDVLAGTGVPDALAVLDVLAVGERTRVVLGAVAGLTPEQLDEVLGAAGPARFDAGWSDDLARVAETVPVGDPRLDEARSGSVVRRRRSRGLAVGGTVAGLAAGAVGAVVGVRAIDPQPGPDAETPTPVAAASAAPAPEDRVVTSGPDFVPTAWYDGRRVHLPDRSVRVPRVAAMVRVGDDVVVTDTDGQVLLVRSIGVVASLGRTDPGALPVADPAAATVAWVDAESGDLVVERFARGQALVALDPGSTVVAVDRAQVFVDGPDGASRLRLTDLGTTRARSGLLDVGAGTQVRTSADDVLDVEVARGPAFRVVGRDGWLSDDGRYLVTRDVTSTAAPPSVVVDLGARRTVRLPLPDSAVVVDAAFAGDDRVTFVLLRPNGTQYPADWPRDLDYFPGFDLAVCDLGDATCQRDAMVFDTDQPPLLAR